MFSSKTESWLGRSAFLMGFVLFWEALCFEVAIGLLERSKDGEVVGVRVLSL